MADQDQRKFIFGLGLARNLAERVGQARLRRVASRERVDVRIARRGLEKFVEVLRERGEALLVVGLASETRDGDVVRRGLRRARAKPERMPRKTPQAARHFAMICF